MAACEFEVSEQTELDVVCIFPKCLYFKLTSTEKTVLARGELKVALATVPRTEGDVEIEEERCFLLFEKNVSYVLNDELPCIKIAENNYVFPGSEEFSYGLRLGNPDVEVVTMFESLLTTYAVFQVKDAAFRENHTANVSSTPHVILENLKLAGTSVATGAGDAVNYASNVATNTGSMVFGGTKSAATTLVSGTAAVTGSVLTGTAAVTGSVLTGTAAVTGSVLSGTANVFGYGMRSLGSAYNSTRSAVTNTKEGVEHQFKDETIVSNLEGMATSVESASKTVSEYLQKGTQFASAKIADGAEIIKSNIGEKEVLEVSDKTLERTKKVVEATGAVASLSSAVIQATLQLSKDTAVGVTHQVTESDLMKSIFKGRGGKKKSGPKIKAAKKVAAATTMAFLGLSAQMLEAGVQLTDDLGDNAVDVVDHKYGEEAALIAKDATDAYKNMNVVRRNFKGFAITVLAKKSAKSAAKEAANDIMSEWYEEEKGMGLPPCGSTILASAIVKEDIEALWNQLQTMDFSWMPHLVECINENKGEAVKIDDLRTLKFDDGTVQIIAIRGLDSYDHTAMWELVSSDPAVSYSGAIYAVHLVKVTMTGETFMQFTSEFTNDASAAVMMDQKFKLEDYLKHFTVEVKESEKNTEEIIYTEK